MKDYSHIPYELLSAVRADSDTFHAYAIIEMFGLDAYTEAVRAVHAMYSRRRRLRVRLDSMIKAYGSVFFITLTIDDDHLRRDLDFARHAKRVLSGVTPGLRCQWILNDDRGDLNGRLHFHACLGCIEDLAYVRAYLSEQWTYGFSQVKVLTDSQVTTRRVSAYMTKLVNHATKETVAHIWYSRIGNR